MCNYLFIKLYSIIWISVFYFVPTFSPKIRIAPRNFLSPPSWIGTNGRAKNMAKPRVYLQPAQKICYWEKMNNIWWIFGENCVRGRDPLRNSNRGPKVIFREFSGLRFELHVTTVIEDVSKFRLECQYKFWRTSCLLVLRYFSGFRSLGEVFRNSRYFPLEF